MREREGAVVPTERKTMRKKKTDVGGNGKTDRKTAVGAKGDITHKPVDL